MRRSLLVSSQQCSPQQLPALTCLQSEAMRLRLLVEMVRVMGMPANFRLLLPRMEFRERPQGWGKTAALSNSSPPPLQLNHGGNQSP